MIANWLKAVWIFLGASVAAGGAAYVTGVFEPAANMPKVEAAVEKPAEQPMAAAKVDQASDDAVKADKTPVAEADKAEPAGEQVAALEPQKEPAAIANAETELVVPSFDLVRVEPDGSVVIAGHAAANSMVEIISGATTIGSAAAGTGGDFAIVLDDPLKAGDYTIVLRSTGEDKVVATSTQTAVISVPETESGQVLALVEEPGAPSRLITVPAAPKAEMAAKDDRPAADEPAKDTMAVAEKPAPVPADKPEKQVAAEEAAKTEQHATAQEEAKPEQQAMVEPAAESDAAAKPEAEEKLAGETAAPEEMAEADQTPPASEQMAAVAEEPKAQEPEAETPMAAAEKPVAPKIAVEAVEIEGRAVYVAGFAEPGSTVRVYANDILLGQADASEAGRFLVEAEKDLPIGDYIVRADMLNKDKSDVLARAAVPFEREPGENVAAIAAPAPVTATEEKPVEAAAAVPTERPVEVAPAQPTDRPEQKVEANPTPRPESEAPKAEMAMTGKTEPETKPDARAADEGETAPMKMTAAPEADAAMPAETTAEPSENLSPKLQNVGGAVIIRRGDTLWRLSRRVYGRGVRYTTIYLANQQQISDPDRIWPGQVFSVPGETDEGEEADMSAVSEQTTDADDVVTR